MSTKTVRKPFDMKSQVRSLASKLDQVGPGEKILEIPLKDIAPDPTQPRRSIDKKKAEMLGLSIKTTGQQQPITVRLNPASKPPYLLLSGERRWLGSGLVGLKTIGAIVRNYSDDQVAAILAAQMAENMGREDMSLADKVAGVSRMLAHFTGQEVAERVNEPGSWVSKVAGIAKAGDSVAAALEAGYIEDVETLYLLARVQKLDVKEARKLVNSWADPERRLNARQQVKAVLNRLSGKTEVVEPTPPPVQTSSKTVTAKVLAEPRRDSATPSRQEARSSAEFSHAKTSAPSFSGPAVFTVESTQVLDDRVIIHTLSGDLVFDLSLLTWLEPKT